MVIILKDLRHVRADIEQRHCASLTAMMEVVIAYRSQSLEHQHPHPAEADTAQFWVVLQVIPSVMQSRNDSLWHLCIADFFLKSFKSNLARFGNRGGQYAHLPVFGMKMRCHTLKPCGTNYCDEIRSYLSGLSCTTPRPMYLSQKKRGREGVSTQGNASDETASAKDVCVSLIDWQLNGVEQVHA